MYVCLVICLPVCLSPLPFSLSSFFQHQHPTPHPPLPLFIIGRTIAAGTPGNVPSPHTEDRPRPIFGACLPQRTTVCAYRLQHQQGQPQRVAAIVHRWHQLQARPHALGRGASLRPTVGLVDVQSASHGLFRCGRCRTRDPGIGTRRYFGVGEVNFAVQSEKSCLVLALIFCLAVSCHAACVALVLPAVTRILA